MTLDAYKCRASCADCNRVDVENIIKDVKPTYLQKIVCENLFKCFCQTICATIRILDMSGRAVKKKIGRNLLDVDIPALLSFLAKHPEITRLKIAHNDITDYGFIDLLDHIINYKNIEELDVQNNNIGQCGIFYLLKARKTLQLKSLNLKGNKLSKGVHKNVALFLLENNHMRSLNVADINQTASSLIYFIMILNPLQETSNATLKTLDISRPNPDCMYFFDSAHFADVIGYMLKHNTTLEALHLQKYGFSCHDIESMVYYAIDNNSLLLLDLGCNNIGDHGIEYIAKWILKRPSLRVLMLHRNIITDHGARSLSFALPFSKLLALDISYNKISDDGMVNIMHTIKKTPLLRQLKMFGNCIGHPVAKIVKRMLLSKVLNQENIDVRPYRVDHKWFIAKYEGERCRKEFENIPYDLSTELPKTPTPYIMRWPNKKYFKYTYSRSTEFKFKHSLLSIVSKTLSKEHVNGCKCCYCFKCKDVRYDEECRKMYHPDICTCCTCKGDESSDWSVDESVLRRVVYPRDIMESIEYILKRVSSDMKDNILKWINMDKETLEEDLRQIGDSNASKENIESTVTCTCSWLQLNISAMQKYLQESSSKNVLIIPKDYNTYCKSSSNETGSTECCVNTGGASR